MTAPEDARKSIPAEDLFIDVGASGYDEVLSMGINVGTPGTLVSRFTELGNGAIMAKALDDRLGCALLIELLEHFSLHRPDFTLAATFSTGEEVGLRGATTAGFIRLIRR